MTPDPTSVLLDIAAEAAQVIREVYDTPFSVEWKGPRDPVTVADKRANDLICARLAKAFPGVPVVAEESDPKSFENYASSERVFFVDPLDGTLEFIDRNGEFVVMIGLVLGDVASVGVICAPATRTAWVGSPAGAFRVDENGRRTPIRVSEISSARASRAVGSRSHRTPELTDFLEGLGFLEVAALGSAGLKVAAVSEGRVEAYVAPGYAGKRWDACAGDAIVTAAGGQLTDGSGARIDYRASSLSNDRGLVATNGRIHEAVIAGLSRG